MTSYTRVYTMNCCSTSFSTPKALKLISYNTQNTSRQMPFLIRALPRKCNTKQAQCANRNGETRKKTKKKKLRQATSIS